MRIQFKVAGTVVELIGRLTLDFVTLGSNPGCPACLCSCCPADVGLSQH